MEQAGVVSNLRAADATYWDLVNAAEEYAGGTGTEADPYQIATPAQLMKLCVDATSLEEGAPILCEGVYYKQIADIDLSASYANNLKIGVGGYFAGNYDGGNFAIKGLKRLISSDEEVNGALIDYALFENVANATIKNVVLEDVSIEVNFSNLLNSSVGGGMLAYAPQNSVIENCSVSGDINVTINGEKTSVYAGGLAAAIVNSEINNCRTEGTMTIKCNLSGESADSNNFIAAGGIVEEISGEGKIMNTVNALSINNESEDASGNGLYVRTGGIMAWCNNENAQILNCANIAPVSAVSNTAGTVQVGGIVACCVNGFLHNVWSASALKCEGGVEGENIGGVVAYFESIGAASCFYDEELSGIPEGMGTKVGSAHETEFMQSQDFVNSLNATLPEGGFAWGHVEGSYPVLTSSTDVPEPEDPTANESVTASETVLRVLPGAVVVTSPEAVEFAAYTFSGAMQANELLPAGTSTVNLPAGLYILKVGDETYKVNVK